VVLIVVANEFLVALVLMNPGCAPITPPLDLIEIPPFSPLPTEYLLNLVLI
jgi:hypothetical protein